MTPQHEQMRTIDDCGKIRASCTKDRADERKVVVDIIKWSFGIVVTVCLLALTSSVGFAISKTKVDTQQDTEIARLKEERAAIQAKLDLIIERLPPKGGIVR